MIDQYDIEIQIDGQKIILIREGYLKTLDAIENYEWARFRDEFGTVWEINTKKISLVKIRKRDEKNIITISRDEGFF